VGQSTERADVEKPFRELVVYSGVQ